MLRDDGEVLRPMHVVIRVMVLKKILITFSEYAPRQERSRTILSQKMKEPLWKDSTLAIGLLGTSKVLWGVMLRGSGKTFLPLLFIGYGSGEIKQSNAVRREMLSRKSNA